VNGQPNLTWKASFVKNRKRRETRILKQGHGARLDQAFDAYLIANNRRGLPRIQRNVMIVERFRFVLEKIATGTWQALTRLAIGEQFLSSQKPEGRIGLPSWSPVV
jgi:hypothetical protein